MNEVIKQKIESIDAVNLRMSDIIRASISSVVNELVQSADISASERNDINSSNGTWRLSTIGMISGAAFLVGSVGWFVCSSLWTKVLFWGGGIGMASDYVLNKRKSRMIVSKDNSIQNCSISTQKQFATQKIMSTIDELDDLWETITKANKEQLLALIENSTLSSDDKFNASSLICVTKTLDFELLKMQNMIDEAKSLTELEDNLLKIRNVLKDKIDKVSNLQIDSYCQVDKIMTEV